MLKADPENDVEQGFVDIVSWIIDGINKLLHIVPPLTTAVAISGFAVIIIAFAWLLREERRAKKSPRAYR